MGLTLSHATSGGFWKTGLLRERGGLMEEVQWVLDGHWALQDGEHEETIYYIGGSVIRTVHSLAKQQKVEEVASALRQLEKKPLLQKKKHPLYPFPCA